MHSWQPCDSLLSCFFSTTHARHNSQNIIIYSIHADLCTGGGTDSVVGEGDEQGGIVNTGKVAGAAGLVLLRLEGEGIHVDTHGRDVGVVLVRLHQVEVATLTLVESIVTVELDLGSHDRIVTSHAFDTGDGVARLQHGTVPPVRVVEGLLTLERLDDGIIAADKGITLDNPDKLLARVVEVQLDLVGGAGDGLGTSELQLLDQVLVRDRGKASALISVQVDVVNIQGGRDQARGGNTVTDGVGGGTAVGIVEAQVVECLELQVDLHLVILKGNQRKSKTRVAAEPELQGNVQGVLRGARGNLVERVGLTIAAIRIAAFTTLDDQVDQLGNIANHVGIPSLLTRLLGQLVPDLEPITIVLVDLLTANLEVDVVDQVVTDPVEPTELGTRTVRRLELNLRQSSLQVDAVDQIAVAADCALHLATEVGSTVEGLLNGFHREVGVATIDDLEDKDLPSLSGYLVESGYHSRTTRRTPRGWTIT